MKDELVSIETGRLIQGIELITSCETRMDYIYDEEVGKLLYMPTQSLLKRWLREKHGIHVSSNPNGLNSMLLPECKVEINYGYSVSFKDSYFTSGYANFFTTYEQALEQGLQEALKLIKD